MLCFFQRLSIKWKSLLGDCIKDYNFNQYKNILVHHSYHYHFPPKLSKSEKSRGVWPETYDGRVKEVYEREIGFELEKLNLPNVVVKEVDNRKRDVTYLLKKYKSRFMLDLHDPGRLFDYDSDADSGIVGIAFSQTNNEYFRKFRDCNYPKDKKQSSIAKISLFPTSYDNFNPRLIGVELFPWIAKEASLNFLKKFTGYLQTHDLYR